MEAVYKTWVVMNEKLEIISYGFNSYESAQRAAEILADANPDKTYTVLESVAEVRKSGFAWTKHDPYPF